MNVYRILSIIIGSGYDKMPVFGENLITAIDFKPNKGILSVN